MHVPATEYELDNFSDFAYKLDALMFALKTDIAWYKNE